VRVLRPHLLSPNGGERLSAGTFRDVSWESEDLNGVDSISLFYSPDGGQSWQSAGSVGGATRLSWRVPADATANALLKVEAYGSGEFIGYDVTDTPFSVLTETTGITPTPELRTALYQNVPNPFHATTTIAYSLAAAGDVSMDVFDISGKRVRVLVRGVRGNGPQVATWDGRDDAGRRVTPGMYVVRLRTGDVQASRRLLLMP
jgi:flagellar hook capping protein FlgD